MWTTSQGPQSWQSTSTSSHPSFTPFSLFLSLNTCFFLRLDEDEALYNSYFRWKGTGELINTKFFCRLCALLHDPKVRSSFLTKFLPQP